MSTNSWAILHEHSLVLKRSMAYFYRALGQTTPTQDKLLVTCNGSQTEMETANTQEAFVQSLGQVALCKGSNHPPN